MRVHGEHQDTTNFEKLLNIKFVIQNKKWLVIYECLVSIVIKSQPSSDNLCHFTETKHNYNEVTEHQRSVIRL